MCQSSQSIRSALASSKSPPVTPLLHPRLDKPLYSIKYCMMARGSCDYVVGFVTLIGTLKDKYIFVARSIMIEVTNVPPPTSPLLPNFSEEPLSFRAEWLKPTVNDVHSRSRLHCLLLSFLRTSRVYLAESPKSQVLA